MNKTLSFLKNNIFSLRYEPQRILANNVSGEVYLLKEESKNDNKEIYKNNCAISVLPALLHVQIFGFVHTFILTKSFSAWLEADIDSSTNQPKINILFAKERKIIFKRE